MTRGLRLAFLLGCLTGGLAAQRYTQVSGTVLDPSEAGVPGAVVTVVNEETGFRRVGQTAPDGGYVVGSLEPGIYKITVRKEGFRTVVRFGARLEALRPARVNFSLSVGSMQETITVEGTEPLLETEGAALSTVIARDELAHLPLNGRGLQGLLDLAPGVVITPATRGEPGQFTVNGQRPNTHAFTVDGVSANTGVSGGGLPAQPTGGVLPALSAFGSLHSLISVEALAEFREETATAAPEAGRLPGATVELTSRSGSSEFHGSAVYTFRHERLDANDWFANRAGEGRAPLRMGDPAAALGGPVRRDRTFFFLSYEGLRLRQPLAWRTAVPSMAARAGAEAWVRPLLDLYPVPNGREFGGGLAEWTGRNNRPSRLDAGSARIDHAASARVTLFGRYSEAPSASEFGSTQVNRLDLRWRSLTAGVTARPRAGVVVDVRLNGSAARGESEWRQTGAAPCFLEPVTTHLLRVPGVCDYLVRLAVEGVEQVVTGREGVRTQGQLQAVGSVGIERGGHSMRAGVDFRRLTPARRDATGSVSVIAADLEDLAAGRDLWTASAAAQNARSVFRELSLSWQDTWHASRALTATYGLRWEYNPAPVSKPAAFYLNPEQGTVMPFERPVWPARYTNFAPRVGVAWRPRAEGPTVLRAGAGVYYDSSLSIATDLLNGGPFSLAQYGNPKYAPFSMLLSFGFMPDLRLPLVTEWSGTVERALGSRETVSLGYAGSAGHRLMRREIGGPGSSQVSWVALATNHGTADYHALQAQYRRGLARGVRALVSYTWSHSLDNSSSDSGLQWAGTGTARARERGSSDFDVRHALSATFAWELPGARGWAVDGVLRARTAFPVTVLAAEHYQGIALANAFRPDQAGGAAWVADAGAPGGRRLARGAFAAAAEGVQGGLGRNVLSGFGMSQLDLALRREFRVAERHAVEFRVEAFNVLNQAHFADPVRYLASPLFGESASMLNAMLGSGSPASGLAPMFQPGGPRSLQVMLRYRF